MNLAALLHNAARSFGDRPAVSVGDELRLTYRELGRRVAQLAGGLRAIQGVRPGDRVALVMSNRPQYPELLFAIWHAGLVAVPINAKLHPREVAFILDNCGVRICVVSEDLAGAIVPAAADVGSVIRVVCVDRPEYDAFLGEPVSQSHADRDDLAWIFYTSGTTGRPKGAMLTHLNLQIMAWSYLCDIDFLTERDVLFHLGPQSHAAGLFSLSHIAKAGHQVLPASGGFDAGELVDLVNLYPNATFFLAPTMLRRLFDAPQLGRLEVDNIRTILCGAAPIYLDDVRRVLAAFGPRFWNGYGQGECPCTITAMPKHLYAQALDDERLVSVGIARTGVEVRVIDEHGRELPAGEIGEIAVRGDVVMKGYWDNAQATAAALEGGWLHTGDLGTMDAEGFLTLKDRSKDLIISGGANIYPREVEEVLLADPAVAEVAVVGAPDREWGERVVAFVVARPGRTVDPAALDRLCLDNIARFKRPKQYEFVSELPKNNYGKVLKTELRARLASSE
jgi:long-chain acyl-CoA synthetase